MKAHTKALVVASCLLVLPSFQPASSVDGPLVDCGACEVKTSGQSIGTDDDGNTVLILVAAQTSKTCEAEEEAPCGQTTGCSVTMSAKTEDADGDPISTVLWLASAEVGHGRSAPPNSSPAWGNGEYVTTGTFGNKDLRDGEAGCNKFTHIQLWLALSESGSPAKLTIECADCAPEEID